MRKLRLGGIKWLGQILRASERQSPDHTEMAYLSRPCTSPCCLWPGRASRNLCQALACSPSHPLLPLTWLHPVSQWDWPQAACNFTDIRVNWLLIEFATGWHWKEVGEGEQKHLGVSLLQSTRGGQKCLHHLCGPAPGRPIVAAGSSRGPCQLLPRPQGSDWLPDVSNLSVASTSFWLLSFLFTGVINSLD